MPESVAVWLAGSLGGSVAGWTVAVNIAISLAVSYAGDAAIIKKPATPR